MNETLEYIDDYFTGTLPNAERAAFENRISADEAFAQEVAFYLNARQVMRQELLQTKQTAWQAQANFGQTDAANNTQSNTVAPVVAIRQKTNMRRLIAIAATVILILGGTLIYNLSATNTTPQEFAAQYSKTHLETLSATMDGSRDSLQLGIKAYNNREYSTAQIYFAGVYAVHPEQTDALTYSGLVSLALKDYDLAISRFQVLSQLPLRANPGRFYQAITLLQRNKPDDAEQAKKLLQSVVNDGQVGSKEAQEWLRSF